MIKNPTKFSIWASVAVIYCSLLVMIGWIFNVERLTYVFPTQINMKFITSFAFVLSGTAMLLIIQTLKGKKELAQIVLPVTSMLTLLLMFTLLASGLFGVQTGIEKLMIEDTASVKTTRPGMPSIPTMLCFVIFGVVSITALFSNIKFLKRLLKITGLFIATIGIVSITGYVINSPMLYWKLDESAVPIALNTAILFCLLGIAMYVASQIILQKKNIYED